MQETLSGEYSKEKGFSAIFFSSDRGFFDIYLLGNNYSVIAEIENQETIIPLMQEINDSPKLSGVQKILSLHTNTVYKENIAEKIIDWLTSVFSLSTNDKARILTCLTESLLNAVIHGNLGICGSEKDQKDISKYYEVIEEKLKINELKSKRIWIFCQLEDSVFTIIIRDDGDGYDYKETLIFLKDQNHRGINIIHSMSDGVKIEEGGKKITIAFNLEDKNYAEEYINSEQAVLINKISSSNIKNAKLLVVDDNQFNKKIIEKILTSSGFINIRYAGNGKEAMEKTRHDKPDLILLDMIMPEMDGFTFCKMLRDEPKFKDIPIIAQTSLTSLQDRIKAFHAGVTDFVGQPLNTYELLVRMYIHLERHYILHELKDFYIQVEQDLKGARELQNSILPKPNDIEMVEKNYNIEVASYFKSFRNVGGDLWGVRSISHEEFSIYTVDFSGHGVTSAINSFRLHTIMKDLKLYEPFPDKFLQELNLALCSILTTGQYATMFSGTLNISDNTLIYSAAAAPTPILLYGNKQVELLNSKGVPLGITTKAEYTSHKISFSPGDLLLIYSDALIETEVEKDRMLNEQDLADILKKNSGKSTQRILDAILSCSDVFKNGKLNDDLTINLYYRQKTDAPS